MRQGTTNVHCAASTSYRPITLVARPFCNLGSRVPSKRIVARPLCAIPDGQQAFGHAAPEVAAHQTDSPGEAPGPRRTAWNKGAQVPDSVRKTISKGLKEKWQDPEFRESQSNSRKGKPAWNKGRTVSEETREKMRLAKLNSSHSMATRQKMSAARRGRPLSPQAASIVSAKLTGKPKSEQHKQNIALSQRKRHSAVRVLKAVEAVYEAAAQQEAAAGTRVPVGVMKRGKADALNAFKSELREYRSLQEELSPWTQAFVQRHSRKPTMMDVQQTGIEWLITRYKQYIVLRERIFNESSLLRSTIGGTGGIPPSAGSLSSGPINANGPSVSQARAAVVTRMSAALEYKKRKQEVAAAAAAAALRQEEGGLEADSAGSGVPSTLLSMAANAMPMAQASPRVRTAMQAAMDYRKLKAQATKAKVNVAAVAAKSAWNTCAGVKGAVTRSGVAAAAVAASPSNGDASSGLDGLATDTAGCAGAAPPSCAVPSDLLHAQAAAARAFLDVCQAEEQVRRALRLDEASDAEDAPPVRTAAGAGA